MKIFQFAWILTVEKQNITLRHSYTRPELLKLNRAQAECINTKFYKSSNNLKGKHSTKSLQTKQRINFPFLINGNFNI